MKKSSYSQNIKIKKNHKLNYKAFLKISRMFLIIIHKNKLSIVKTNTILYQTKVKAIKYTIKDKMFTIYYLAYLIFLRMININACI